MVEKVTKVSQELGSETCLVLLLLELFLPGKMVGKHRGPSVSMGN